MLKKMTKTRWTKTLVTSCKMGLPRDSSRPGLQTLDRLREGLLNDSNPNNLARWCIDIHTCIHTYTQTLFLFLQRAFTLGNGNALALLCRPCCVQRDRQTGQNETRLNSCSLPRGRGACRRVEPMKPCIPAILLFLRDLKEAIRSIRTMHNDLPFHLLRLRQHQSRSLLIAAVTCCCCHSVCATTRLTTVLFPTDSTGTQTMTGRGQHAEACKAQSTT